jgi:Asp-tRNA(Asn)/Glu-tRNA(Gln) amidotransferase A subunit family amidase
MTCSAADLLAPSALGTAPHGLASTGDPVFCRPWTALGVPTLGFPAGTADGLPLGLQLIGREGTDQRVLAQAAHLLGEVVA